MSHQNGALSSSRHVGSHHQARRSRDEERITRICEVLGIDESSLSIVQREELMLALDVGCFNG